MKERSDIAVIGLGVMGSGIARNLENKGSTVSVYNRSAEKTAQFMEQFGGGDFRSAESLQELCGQLEPPRKVLMMVKAGDAVDETLQEIVPFLSPGDVLIDGGNSNYQDTERRLKIAESAGFLYVGCGISGGEEGALNGPAIMPGGSEAAKDLVMPILLDICARTQIGEACCSWMGKGGAGHFVKMVHNGIEYCEMQMICEIWDLMRRYLGMDTAMCGRTFARWAQKTPSYLLETAAQVLQKKDADGSLLVERILDAAQQKGTGAWAVQAGTDMGVPVSILSEAVQARNLSSRKETRREAAEKYGKDRYCGAVIPADRRFAVLQQLQDALHAGRILAFAQGFDLLKTASVSSGWDLNLGEVALCWRSGCILRSGLLEDIKQSYVYDKNLSNLMLSNVMHSALQQETPGLRAACLAALENGIPAPCLTAALQYFDGMTSKELPANLLQGMRDLFGAHTYERTDAPRGEFFHTEW
ncbi:MAG: decarboxylating NADP(+)-dependent phosphogluconate dehydrogenase [Firmicutes bacterium]|nr:decarboxylating NADP(+)-dependent phosphogluconate dehydrogenase [Bacillota bacterium]